MKTAFFSVLFFVTVLIVLVGFSLVMPYYYYNKFVNSGHSNKWFGVRDYTTKILKPLPAEDFEKVATPNEQLWRKFHFGDLNIPLPVKNPFYYVTPILQFQEKSKTTDFGLSISSPSGRKLLDVYYLANKSFPNFLNNHDLFQIPILARQIKEKTNEQIWKDVFTKEIGDWNIPYSEMVYNLYLLEFRSKMMSSKVEEFQFHPKTNMASFKLEYFNKDYVNELIITKRGQQLFSFILISEKNDADAKILRSKLIHEIEYIKSTPGLSDIIYNEYKALDFRDQIDHKGMLFLLSAWSHTPNNEELIKEAIASLERGRDNENVLEALYKYAFERFGKVFTSRKIKGIELPPEILLKRNIELENQRNKKKMIRPSIAEPVQTTIEDEYQNIIDKAKKSNRVDDRVHID